MIVFNDVADLAIAGSAPLQKCPIHRLCKGVCGNNQSGSRAYAVGMWVHTSQVASAQPKSERSHE